eukprot:CAMPEP_0175122408 /NCGR_PEP_ID=MMETSP0087-20121206/1699_1 /TAXON_ID=136419 /ORGANISM="Unknown Unknown, Strain D1" /LENGTH=424 /DNA_ID=CAMNT_0016404041 /DNA_START=65 /DNA_END=1336 /DNA_ORIENTATION=+
MKSMWAGDKRFSILLLLFGPPILFLLHRDFNRSQHVAIHPSTHVVVPPSTHVVVPPSFHHEPIENAARAGVSPVSHQLSACSLPADRENPAWPIHSVDPIIETGYCKHEKDVCPSIFLSLDRIWEEIKKMNPKSMSNYVVNLGSADGIDADPLYPLLDKYPDLIGGTFVESKPDWFAKLQNNYSPRFPKAQLRNLFLSPSTVASVVKEGNTKDQDKTMDVLKVDTDGCDCHLLENLLKEESGYFHAKVIQVELNHHIVPPIAYKDMCKNDVYGRTAYYNKDIWGCSMQAAYDVVRPYGYVLLQHDWPDAVFIHSDFVNVFPCFFKDEHGPAASFMRNYWIGYEHARKHYERFPSHQDDKAMVARLPELASKAALDPQGVIKEIVEYMSNKWDKPNHGFQVNLGIAGTGVAAIVTKPVSNIEIEW